jgi:hypothetical protein
MTLPRQIARHSFREVLEAVLCRFDFFSLAAEFPD